MASQLFEWNVVRTEPGSQALIDFKDGIQVAVNENSAFRVLGRGEKTKGITCIVRLQQGEMWVKTGVGPKLLEVETPVATAAVRETEFNIKVLEDGQTILTVIQGVVEFGTAFGTCPIRTGTISYGVRGKRYTKPEATDISSQAFPGLNGFSSKTHPWRPLPQRETPAAFSTSSCAPPLASWGKSLPESMGLFPANHQLEGPWFGGQRHHRIHAIC